MSFYSSFSLGYYFFIYGIVYLGAYFLKLLKLPRDEKGEREVFVKVVPMGDF